MLATIPARRSATLAILLAAVALPARGQWTPLAVGTTASLRGLSVVDARTVWASGTAGTVVHTTDGGETWTVDTIPGARAFDLRSVHARSARVAWVAATAGRIWRTIDGGKHWVLQHQAADSAVFLDAIDFWDDQHGMALGDPIDGRFHLLATNDGGDTWRVLPLDQRPVAMPGEAAFAASGSSLLLQGVPDSMQAWIATGGATARVHRRVSRARGWVAYDTPMRQGSPAEGIFSLAEIPGQGFMIVGGHYEQADSARANAATSLSGTIWRPVSADAPRGYRSGVAFARIGGAATVGIAVGPGGSDLSRDGGTRWASFDSAGYHAVRASRDGIFFAAGSGGRMARFDARALR